MLLLLKVRWPDRITLLRGNHETRQVNLSYLQMSGFLFRGGFYDECIRKYDDVSVWRSINEVFDLLSISALVEEEVFVVHGGLSPYIQTINQILDIDRTIENGAISFNYIKKGFLICTMEQ